MPQLTGTTAVAYVNDDPAPVTSVPMRRNKAYAEAPGGGGAQAKPVYAVPGTGRAVRDAMAPRQLRAASVHIDMPPAAATRTFCRGNGPPVPWNHGDIGRKEAEGRLIAAGAQEGLYLARQKSPDVFAISVVFAGSRGTKFVHHLLELRPDGTYAIDGGAKGSCGSLEEAVSVIATARVPLCRPGETLADLESAA